jgi:hypothetical protein
VFQKCVLLETTQHYISEGSDLHTRCHENLNSHNYSLIHEAYKSLRNRCPNISLEIKNVCMVHIQHIDTSHNFSLVSDK